jgi:hypothetical protein
VLTYFVPELQSAFELLARDPFLAYSLLAAVFLLSVSLGSGWARFDFLATLRPTGLFHVSIAVLIAIGLMILSITLNVLLHEVQYQLVQQVTGIAQSTAWPLGGLSRLPLYVIALAYGPTAGLLAAGFFAAFTAETTLPGWPEAVLALELTVLGWLGIYPSAYQYRWAGPLNAFVAYILAWGTAGLALLHMDGGAVTVAGLWRQHQSMVGGAVLGLVLLFFVSPPVYRSLFRLSRITPMPRLRRRDDPVLVTRALPDTAVMNQVIPGEATEFTRTRRRKRELDPLPPKINTFPTRCPVWGGLDWRLWLKVFSIF